jgi:hypothetical protein
LREEPISLDTFSLPGDMGVAKGLDSRAAVKKSNNGDKVGVPAG